jgi:pimeloyl-ACP methyl ester carboxylesterase
MMERALEMPRLGETMEEGRVVGWLIKPGDHFKRGDPILEIETDKTIAEFPALMDGRLIRILSNEGDMVTVGEPIALIEVAGDAPAAQKPMTAPQSTVAPAPPPRSGDAQEARKTVRATPLARRLARSHGLDITEISGSGRRGRIEKNDVLAKVGGGGGYLPEASAGVRYASLPRGRMAYLESGPASGSPILLLHGFSGDHTTWAALGSSLARAGHRVIAPDLPGHGATDISATSLSDLGADLLLLLDSLEVSATDVVAHSLGAVAAMQMASAAPVRVAALSLLAPAGLGSDIDSQFVSGMANAKVSGDIVHLLRRLAVGQVQISDGALQGLADELARGRLIALADAALGAAGQRADILPAVQKLSNELPVRVLFGLEDKIIPWTQVQNLPPQVSIHLLARSGHMPHWDQPGDVLKIISRKAIAA